MELFLNFLWVLIAVSGLGVWRVCWAPGRSGQREPLREWTAIVAALVLLFFAVSLTDDLHSDLVLFEESANGRRQGVALVSPHSLPHDVKIVGGAVADAPPRLHGFVAFQCLGYVNSFEDISASLSETELLFERGPPSLAL
jgi:hypothetical protein